MWDIPASGSTTGTLGLSVSVRNSSDKASVDFDARGDEDPSNDRIDKVVIYCKPVGDPNKGVSRAYAFALLRDGGGSFINAESEQRLHLGVLCHGRTLDNSTDHIEYLEIELWVDNTRRQVATHAPDSPFDWPFGVTNTMWYKQSDMAVGGDMMGGLQLYMEIPGPDNDGFCTSSFSLELEANSAATQAVHGLNPFQVMSTTAHCQELNGTWHQGGANARNQLVAETLEDTLWLPPQAVPTNTSCEITVEDGEGTKLEELPDCNRGDQTYSMEVPVPGSTWTYANTSIYRPHTTSPSTVVAIAKPIIEYFKKDSANRAFNIVGARPPQQREEVHKVGRTTGWTSGRIINYDTVRGREDDPRCTGSPIGPDDNGPWTDGEYNLDSFVKTPRQAGARQG